MPYMLLLLLLLLMLLLLMLLLMLLLFLFLLLHLLMLQLRLLLFMLLLLRLGRPGAMGLHSSTILLNVSTFCGIRWLHDVPPVYLTGGPGEV
jgi:hypothetical protein